MNKFFYPKLALSNISKNRKTYFPFILTCIFTVMMYFIMSSLIGNNSVARMRNGDSLISLLKVAVTVTQVFSVIFLFYTNSFLLKRRTKELGILNILGMEKRHIGFMLFFETLFTFLVSVISGIGLGILFNKYVIMFLEKLMFFDSGLEFELHLMDITGTLVLFVFIFALILLYSLMKVRLSNPIELVRGKENGEKEPKTKIIMTLIGIIAIGAGYWYALTVESPFDALSYFLLAVLSVVVGTYAIFTAGSIAFLKILRKNKKYYYKTSHFINVSGMLYRMKQNAVGLANICILSTMVLIIFSTTVSLYTGIQDRVATSMPRDFIVTAGLPTYSPDTITQIDQNINEILKENHVTAVNDVHLTTVMMNCSYENGELNSQRGVDSNSSRNSETKVVYIYQLNQFNQLNGSNYRLEEGEALVYSSLGTVINDRLTLSDSKGKQQYRIKGSAEVNVPKLNGGALAQVSDTFVIVVTDINQVWGDMAEQVVYYERFFDMPDNKTDMVSLTQEVNSKIQLEDAYVLSDNIVEKTEDFYSLYGGFMFIGIFLGIMFLMATCLIIYYKQISEGYEDKERFEIMQKVGMSHEEVKKSIKNQVLMIFFLPLVIAGIHIFISFRVIKIMLLMIGLANAELFFISTVGAFVIFSIVYFIVFVMTEKVYYDIVRKQ